MSQSTHEQCINTCNELLRGEISAVETYEQAIGKFASEPSAPALRRIKQDHETNVSILRSNVVNMGGTPSEDSGAWGSFAQSVAGSAKLFGENAAVWALKQGEEMGLNNYKSALESDGMPADCRLLIRENLLPKQKEHIATLENLPH